MEQKYKTILAYYLGRKEENPSTRWLDRVICFFTRSRFSHVELVYDFSEVSKIGLSWSSSPRDGGVRPQRIDFSSGHWELYEIPTEFNEEAIISWFNYTRQGSKYDWFGALGAYWPIFRQDPNKWFCSEIIAACLGVHNASTLTPQELFEYYSQVHKKIDC